MPLGSINSGDNGDGARTKLSQRSNQDVLQNTDELKQKINKGNSNIASHRQFRETLSLGNYELSSQAYRDQADQAGASIGIFADFQVAEGTSLEDFKAIKKEQAGYRPDDFKFQYGKRATNVALADFDNEQHKYWQEQDEFMSINTDRLLTKELEGQYTTLIAMEDDYRSLLESGDKIESFKLKDKIGRFKAQIDVLKLNRVNQLS